MRVRNIIIILTALLITTITSAKVIPLKDFAQKSQFKTVKISPDGKHVAYTYEEGTEVKVGIINLKTKKGIYSFDVGENREVVAFWWGNNDRVVVLGGKITGWLDGANKYYELIAVNIDGKKRESLWDFQRAGINLISLLDNDEKHVLVTKRHYADKGAVSLFKMNIYNGKMTFVDDTPKTIGGGDSVISSISLDLLDKPKVAIEYDPVEKNNFDDDIIRVHVKNLKGKWDAIVLPKIKNDKPLINSIGISSDNSVIYFISDYDLEDGGTLGLFSYDIKSKSINKLFRNPDVDIKGSITSPEGALIGVYYDAGYRNYYYVDDVNVKKEIEFHKSMRASFKNQNINFINYSEDNKLATLQVYSDKNPGDFYIFDRVTNKAEFLASSMPNINPQEMASVEPFMLNARDGLKMYGLMTLPLNKELKNLPLVIYPHGGPYGVNDNWRWDNRAQLLANRGYLVIQLDFRGSGGYGENFEEAGQSEWGAKMQDDLTDVTKWAINQGYADKDRVCIHGVSYGGYASMQAVVREPDLYKCAIPDAGVYDINLQMKKADSFYGGKTKQKHWFLSKMLGDNWELLMNERSPAYNVDKIKADLLLVHGKEDVRVPIENSYILEEKLKKAGKKYQTLYKKDGHGFQNVKNRIALYKKMVEFLEENIGSN